MDGFVLIAIWWCQTGADTTKFVEVVLIRNHVFSYVDGLVLDATWLCQTGSDSRNVSEALIRCLVRSWIE